MKKVILEKFRLTNDQHSSEDARYAMAFAGRWIKHCRLSSTLYNFEHRGQGLLRHCFNLVDIGVGRANGEGSYNGV